MRVPVSFRTLHAMANKRILVDSGATDNFIHPKLIKRLGLGTQALDRPRKIWNIDGTNNRGGELTHFVDLDVRTGKQEEQMRFLVTDLGGEDLVLGYPWLATFEPKFNWREAVIDTTTLPIVIRSLDWKQARIRPTIVGMMTDEEKEAIVEELETLTAIRSISTKLAIEAEQYTAKVEIPQKYKQHARVFSEEDSQRFPPTRTWDHAINLKPGSPDSLNCKIYPTTPVEKVALKEWINEMEGKKYIRRCDPNKAYIMSSFFFINKKDGKRRPVQDYRPVNKMTERDYYPLRLILAVIAEVGEASIFTKFDIRWGYNNIRIKDGDQHKAAFKTEFGLFEPMVMFFGLTNSPATFQRMMDTIFAPLKAKHALLGTSIQVYMDDILIASSKGLEGHQDAVDDVLDLLAEHDLFLKPEKCKWETDSIDYLGLILEKGVTRMDPTKVSGIRDWPTPTSVKQVRSFLGFCNFYRSFIRGFSKLARPLNQLTRKDTPWTWGPEENKAFEDLRLRVTTEPILAQPQVDKQFELEVDASGFATGAVLMQRGEDNKKHPVGYYSATLNDAEQNYNIYDLELLAVVNALEHWRHFLAGSPHKVIVYTDHLNLQYWREPHKISRRIARQVLRLAEYDIELKHIPGKTNGRADALSRRPDYDQGSQDNENITVLPDSLFARATHLDDGPMNREAQDEEELRPWVDPHGLRKVEEVWWKDGRRVVTGNAERRRQLVHDHHDLPAYGHPGISRTTDLVSRHYWWPRLRQDVLDYVKGCADCQRNKVNNHPKKAALSPIFAKPDALPFETVAMDFIVKLPLSEGFDSILTITDHDCTKMTVFIPCNEAISAEGVAQLYLQHVFKNYGLPRKIISDRDTRFTGKFMRELCRILGIQQNMSTAYHPRTDGQSEQNNQWVEQFFRFYIDEDQKNWAFYLPLAEFAHNSWKNESTGHSPFEVLMGYNPRAEWTTVPSPIPQVTLRLDQFKKAREQAQRLMRKAQQGWEKHKREGRIFQEGDQVWLEGRHIKTHQPMAKLAAKRHGPFKVTRVLSPLNYQLELPVQWKIHDVFHADLLTPYHETDFHGRNYERPPPDLINGEEEYEIERVVDSRRHGRGGKIQYLVKWKGYPDSENQWVSWDDVNAPELLAEFKERNPNALSHIRGVVGDENLTSLGFPPTTVRSSLTPALHSFIRSILDAPETDKFMILPETHLPNTDTPTSHVASNGAMVDGGAVPVFSLGPVRDSPRQGAQETRTGSSSKEGETQAVEETTRFLHQKIAESRDRLRGPIPDFRRRPSIEPYRPELNPASLEDWTMPSATWLAGRPNLPRRVIWGYDSYDEEIVAWQMQDGRTLTDEEMVLERQPTGGSITDTIQYQCKCRAKKGGQQEGCLRCDPPVFDDTPPTEEEMTRWARIANGVAAYVARGRPT
jgi:hypothetical protein